MSAFKDRMNELFKELNLTQVSLSKKTGVSQSSLSEYLLGKKEPTISVVMKIAEALDISLDWLLLGKGEMFQDNAAKPKRQIHPEDIPKENIKLWLDYFWEKADDDTKTWLIVEIKRRFPEFCEWLEKYKDASKKNTRILV